MIGEKSWALCATGVTNRQRKTVFLATSILSARPSRQRSHYCLLSLVTETKQPLEAFSCC